MELREILCEPIVCGCAMALVSWLILDFWQGILSIPNKKLPPGAVKLVLAFLNGAMSYCAEIFTQNNASPRTISLYIPVMLILELHLLGHMKNIWGTFSVLVLTSFQMITMYSITLGTSYMLADREFMASRFGMVIPVTLLNLILSYFLFSVKVYKIRLGEKNRDAEVEEVLSDRKSSMVLIVYALVNAIAVTALTYDSLDMLNRALSAGMFVDEVARNMIVRDSVLFFSTVLMLDLQTRKLKSEHEAQKIIADNILREKSIETQKMVQMGLEAARKELEKKNKKLETGLEYEKRLRKSLRRNILFRFSCNVTKGIIDEAGALNIDPLKDGSNTSFEAITQMFLELLVHPDHREELAKKMSIENLSTISYVEKGFNVPIRISPREFINYVTLDDDSAKIYAYVDREYIWTDLDCTVVVGDDGDTYAYFYLMDINEQKQREEAIKKAASTDALTGLLNRKSFTELLIEYLSNDNSKGGALFMFDLDYFKSVNDSLGHPKGDELLKDVAEILNNTFRNNDLICRIGGDEFCAFAKGLTDMELIIQRAKTLNETGRKIFETPEGGEVRVSFSIGIAVISDGEKDSKQLYKNADSALYNAKESGRDCFRVYSQDGQ